MSLLEKLCELAKEHMIEGIEDDELRVAIAEMFEDAWKYQPDEKET